MRFERGVILFLRGGVCFPREQQCRCYVPLQYRHGLPSDGRRSCRILPRISFGLVEAYDCSFA